MLDIGYNTAILLSSRPRIQCDCYQLHLYPRLLIAHKYVYSNLLRLYKYCS
jgi:hypothetical protein